MYILWPRTNQSKDVNSKRTTIIIGSKNFTESKIVMQIWADALKKKGYRNQLSLIFLVL